MSESVRKFDSPFCPASHCFLEITFIRTCYFNCHFELNNHAFEVSTIHVDIDWIGIALLQYEGVRFCVAVLIFEICIMHFSVNHNHDPIQSNEIIQFHEE